MKEADHEGKLKSVKVLMDFYELSTVHEELSIHTLDSFKNLVRNPTTENLEHMKVTQKQRVLEFSKWSFQNSFS